MQPIQRVEIVADGVSMDPVLDVVRAAGDSGFPGIRNLQGEGERGVRRGDALTDGGCNSLVIAACSDPEVKSFVDALRPILSTRGGLCLVPEGLWVKH